jgi:hypothetical protein
MLQQKEAEAVQRVCGALMPRQGLRYKKKMNLLSMATEGRSGHVAYCMMTFVIRNGLRALRLDAVLYMQYVRGLVQRWGLSSAQQALCIQFAKSWAAWLRVHDTKEVVSPEKYLDAAECFAEAYVAGQLPRMSDTSFRGVVLAVGFDSAFLAEVQEASGIMGFAEANKNITWSRSLPEMGYLISVNVVAGGPVRR